MAPRSRYRGIQRQIGTRSFQSPTTYSIQESKNTTRILTTALDSMSNYFMKQASNIAEIEGAEYGAANTPTVEEYKNLVSQDINPLENINRNTVFGAAAYNNITKTLSNNLTISAKKQMDELYLSAEKNIISIDEFEKDLNSIINETSKLANTVSPIVQKNVTSDLNIAANGHYYKYGLKINKVTSNSLKGAATLVLDDHLNTLDNKIFAILPKDGKPIDSKDLAQKIYGKGGIRDTLLQQYSSTMIGARFERAAFKSGIKDWNTAFETAMFSTIQTLAFNNSKDLSDITDDLRRGKATGDPKIDALISGLSLDERQRLATKISTTASNQNQIEDLMSDEINEASNEAALQLEIEITNDIEQGQSQDIIKEKLHRLKKLVDLDENNNAWETLTKLNNKSGGIRTVSDPNVLKDLTRKAGFGTLSFNELNKSYDSLTTKDFKTLLGTLNSQQKEGFADARVVLAKELGFLVDREITDKNDPQYAKGEVFVQILGKLQEEELVYNKTKESQTVPFNHVNRVKELVKVDGEMILQKIYTDKKDSFKRNYFDTFAKDYPDLFPPNTPMTRENVIKMQNKLEDMLTDEEQRFGAFKSGTEKREKDLITKYISITKGMLEEERFVE
tara:strand:- start:5911 stop:7770 length:1860 start_codon:yes stop_codon:yes gene_type:complete